jgi:hypothetical protein
MIRGYTVREIDDLREVCEKVWLYGTRYYSPNWSGGVGRSYLPEVKTKCVEEIVRTYMIAGITADDLIREYSS